MKIALINGSPKIKDSASDCVLQELKVFLEQHDNIIFEHHFRKPQLSTEEMCKCQYENAEKFQHENA